MIKIGVTGGKGGTGKSFVATNLAVLLSQATDRLVLADLDVEAPNDHILLGVGLPEEAREILVFFPKIVAERCTGCGACAKVCDTGAIIVRGGLIPFIFPRLCSGCKACYYACPYKAILPGGRRVLGYMYVQEVNKWGESFSLVTGVLREGEEHTPPAVLATKRLAESLRPSLLIADTGAGTGNSVSVAIQGSRLVIAVTEPTPLGLHDLQAILRIARGMEMRVWVVVNRAGIGDEERVRRLAREMGAERVYRIPYSRRAAEAYTRGVPIVVHSPRDPASEALREIAGDLAGEIAG